MPRALRFSIIIPTWNGEAFLGPCLESLISRMGQESEIIVVDDASSDGTVDVAERHALGGRLRIFRNATNGGFAHAVNQGLRVARGDALVLLNQDTLSPSDWLTPLLGAMAADRRIGIAGCRLLYPNGQVQHAGGQIGSRGEGGHFQADPALDRNGLADVDFVTGAALAISRSCLQAIGPLDEGFSRAYYEDVDWCFRARRASFRVVYCPGAELIHAEASMAAGADIESLARFNTNRLRFVLKHFSLDRLARDFATEERNWLLGLGAGRATLAAAMQRALYRQIIGLPMLVRAREATLGTLAADEMDTIAHALISLRATAPLAAGAPAAR